MENKREAVEEIIGSREALKLGVELEEENIQFVIVTLADELYGFFGHSITSIAMVRDITPIPGTPDYVLGVMYHQGRVESIIDLKKILGLADTAVTRKSRVALAVTDEAQTGILVDAVEDVVDLPARGIFAPLHTMEAARKEYVAGETEYRGRNVVILDLARIFGRVLEPGNGEQ